MEVELIKVYTDDYEVIYVNGTSEWGGHSIQLEEVIRGLIGKKVSSITTYYISEETMEEKYGWNFPNTFAGFNKDDLE